MIFAQRKNNEWIITVIWTSQKVLISFTEVQVHYNLHMGINAKLTKSIVLYFSGLKIWFVLFYLLSEPAVENTKHFVAWAGIVAIGSFGDGGVTIVRQD